MKSRSLLIVIAAVLFHAGTRSSVAQDVLKLREASSYLQQGISHYQR